VRCVTFAAVLFVAVVAEDFQHFVAEPNVASLMPLVYDELRRIAARYIRGERQGQTLQATALVNEAFLRLAAERPREFENRAHFVAIAALSMRQILVQRARARRAVKRGGAPERVTLDDQLSPANAGAGLQGMGAFGTARDVELIALDDALTRLSEVDPDLVRIVELRYFAGLTVEETAEATGVSPATVKRHWAVARAWLKRSLTGETDSPEEPRRT
jgi:RNA polymerase sigma factor (TIGR02999 family)